MNELESFIRVRLEAWLASVDSWLKGISTGGPDARAPEIECLIKKIKDQALARSLRVWTSPNYVYAVADIVRASLQIGDVVKAEREREEFEQQRRFIEGHLNRPFFKRGRDNIKATSEGGKAKAKKYSWKPYGPKWQREINAALKKNQHLSYLQKCKQIALRDGASLKALQRHTKNPAKT